MKMDQILEWKLLNGVYKLSAIISFENDKFSYDRYTYNKI